jgi:hypothetical protein
MSNRTYDTLKYIALIVLPALATLILALTKIWGIPYGEAIAATITAVDTFLGTTLKISSINYNGRKLDDVVAMVEEMEREKEE